MLKFKMLLIKARVKEDNMEKISINLKINLILKITYHMHKNKMNSLINYGSELAVGNLRFENIKN